MDIQTDYLQRALDPADRHEILEAAMARLKDVQFDAVAFTGMSGASIAPVIAYMMSKALIVVRKESDSLHSHSCQRVEGPTGMRYVVVDDFTFSGATIERIKDQIKQHLYGCTFVGTYLYRDDHWHPAPEPKAEPERTTVHDEVNGDLLTTPTYGVSPLAVLSEMYGPCGILTTDMWDEATLLARSIPVERAKRVSVERQEDPFFKLVQDAMLKVMTMGKPSLDKIPIGITSDRVLPDGRVEVQLQW